MSRVLEGLRLSELARCPRQCAMRGLVEPSEPPERAKRWMARGQMFGYYAYLQFADRYGKDQVQREVEIDWGLGTGHADLYVIPERLIVEVVSSTSPDAIVGAKIRQARQYLHFHPEAESAAVFVINPSDLDREDLIPVVLRPEDIAEIEADVQAVRDALAGGELPPCVAVSPSECRHSLFCSFTEQAWQGWEPPEPLSSDDPELGELVRALYDAKRDERATAAELDARRSLRTEIEQRLAILDVPAGRDVEVAGLKLRRTVVKGRETFSLSTAKKSGVWTPVDDERFGPFCKVGSASERWSVDRASGATADLDFGEAAPF